MNNNPQRILVVEDDDMMAQLIRLFLEEDGHEVRITGYGRHIFRIVAEYQPDLITVDILLPDVDGLHISRQLRLHPDTRDIPILFITVLEERRQEALDIGAVGFLAKPFHGKDLRDAVRQALRRRV